MKSRAPFSLWFFALLMLGMTSVMPAWAAEESAAASTTEAAAPAHEEPRENLGFPQLNAKTYASQVFWLFISFVLLYTLMSKIALPRVGSVLETRRAQREGSLGKAEQLSEEAEKIKAAYEKSLAQAQRTAAEALASAGRAVSEKLSEEQSRFADNSRKRLVTAEQNIVKAKADALHSLTDISAEIAADMVQKITDVQVSKADAKQAVTAVMQKKA